MIYRVIFIACATESKKTASVFADRLAARGFIPRVWWEQFSPGSKTIDTLLKIARTVDGAVFICSALDKARFRSSNVVMPRDNLIFEFGIFLPILGPERTILLKDESTKLPSDIYALNHGRLSGNDDIDAEGVASHFERVFTEPEVILRSKGLNIIVDEQVTNRLISGKSFLSLHTRSLYVGLEGTRAWLTVCEDPAYQSDEVKADLRRDILEMINHIKVRTFVSLGPGDGKLDRDIAIVLRNHEHSLRYIPVDISNGLLHKSYSLLAQHVLVPVGILGDFEDNYNFIYEGIRPYARSPILYGIIGNTFGNLDSCEFRFMLNVKSRMSKSDYFLIEYAAIKKGAPEQTTAPPIASLSEGFKYLLATSIASRLGMSVETVVKEIEKFLVILVSDDSSVPGTQALEYKVSSNDQIIAHVRRYDQAALEAWLQDRIGLKIVESRRIESPKVVDRGLVLVKR